MDSRRRSAVLVIASLGLGGAQKTCLELARHWLASGIHVTLVTLDTQPDRFALPEGLARRRLDFYPAGRGLVYYWRLLRRVRWLGREIKQLRPDLVVSFIHQTNVEVVLALLGRGVPVVVSERGDPRRARLPWQWAALRAVSYRWAAAVVVLTDDARRWARSLNRNVKVIPNAVRVRGSASHRPSSPPTILGLGRLARPKGFDLLITAFAAVSERNPEWRLVIAGDGPEEAELRALAAGLDVDVQFPGFVQDTEQLLQAASIFSLSSRTEGFPNALLEAMSIGVPAVATRCGPGVEEIIEDSRSGLLVPSEDVDALASALEALMRDPATRSRLGAAGRTAVARFSGEAVWQEWDHLFTRVTSLAPTPAA